MYLEQESQAHLLVWICEQQNVICFLVSFLNTSFCSTCLHAIVISGVGKQSWLQVEIADTTPGENSLPAATRIAQTCRIPRGIPSYSLEGSKSITGTSQSEPNVSVHGLCRDKRT